MKKLKPELVEERISNTFSIPKDIMMGLMDIHLLGNRECIIENYRGIVICSETEIRLRGKKGAVSITGKKLLIRYYTDVDMKISGYIDAITFVKERI